MVERRAGPFIKSAPAPATAEASVAQLRGTIKLARVIVLAMRANSSEVKPHTSGGQSVLTVSFCRSFDELRNYFRPRQRCNQAIPVTRKKEQFRTKVDALQSAFLARS